MIEDEKEEKFTIDEILGKIESGELDQHMAPVEDAIRRRRHAIMNKPNGGIRINW